MEEKRKLVLFLNSVEGAKSSKDYAKKEQELFVLCIKIKSFYHRDRVLGRGFSLFFRFAGKNLRRAWKNHGKTMVKLW